MDFVVGMEKGFASKRDEVNALLKSAGASSVETYVLWKDLEGEEPGKFNFEIFDKDLDSLEEASLKWVPFIVIGPWYSTPSWFMNSNKSVRSVCLEHKKDGGNQSIWSPYLKEQVARVLSAFKAHYVGRKSIESILVGISGDYGEAIQTVMGNWPGKYHGHRGYWAGDEFAKSSFREYLISKYGSIGGINSSWETDYSWEEIRPFLPSCAPSRKAALDFYDWYVDSMNSFADWWLGELDDWKGQVYLVVGGIDEPEHGSSIARLTRIAAKHKRGIRITNEKSDYVINFLLTRIVSTASRHYGTYFSTEPSGSVDEKGVVARIYNAYSSGAVAYHDYIGNVYGPEGEKTALTTTKNYLGFFNGENETNKPEIEVGLLISQNFRLLNNWWIKEEKLGVIKKIREITDFDFLNEDLIGDGALSRYKFLIAPFPFQAPADTLDAIVRWIGSGGILISSEIPSEVGGDYAGPGDFSMFKSMGGIAIRDIYGDRALFESLMGIRDEVIGISGVITKDELISGRGYVSKGYRVSAPRVKLHAVMSFEANDPKAVVWSSIVGSGAIINFSGEANNPIFAEVLMGSLYRTEVIKEGAAHLNRPYDVPIKGVFASSMKNGRLAFYNSNESAITLKHGDAEVKIGPNQAVLL
ncbi:MAG: alpha-amylase family protein [Thermoprotei archaeon]